MNIMMTLGVFPFMMETAVFNEFNRTINYNWAEQKRLPHPKLKYIGMGGPAMQYFGMDQQTITLNGSIYPGQFGFEKSLTILKAQAGSGVPLPLLSAEGRIMRFWVIEAITEKHSDYVKGASEIIAPLKIEFTMNLKEYIDFEIFNIGNL